MKTFIAFYHLTSATGTSGRISKKCAIAVGVFGIGLLAAACSAPHLPKGVLDTSFRATDGTAHLPNKALVPFAELYNNNYAWEKIATPPAVLKPYAIAGCDEATTSFDQLDTYPVASEF